MPSAKGGWNVSRSFSDRLWTTIEPTYAAILDHPFLLELRAGTLAREAFAFYICQDSHYLRAFARTLSVLAAKAPEVEDGRMLNRHALNAIAVEQELHEQFRSELAVNDVVASPVAPTCLAYTSFLQMTAYAAPFADGIAAVLPCYWIYERVGRELAANGSPDAVYQRWIDAYASSDYRDVVAELLGLVDRVPAYTIDLDTAVWRCRTAAVHEWMFWDAAYRLERWPLEQ
jgi:thiaminase/transcriptional activator TenA